MEIRRVRIPCLFAATLLPLSASTILDPADVAGITAQNYRDEAALYGMVGTVGGSGFQGSGVMISDRWVLTAGHVSISKAGGTYRVNGVNYTIDSVITHPSHNLVTSFSDIGLLHLSAPVTGVQAATLFDFQNSSSLLGRQATWVGHGFGGTGLTGSASQPVDFRAFTNIIDVVGTIPAPPYTPPTTAFVSDFDRPDGSTNAPLSDSLATRLEGALAPGDSGGGVFVEIDGVRYLVGINSYTAAFTAAGQNSKYGAINGATNIDLFHDWIYANTGISPVPEPGVTSLALIGLLLGFRRRR